MKFLLPKQILKIYPSLPVFWDFNLKNGSAEKLKIYLLVFTFIHFFAIIS